LRGRDQSDQDKSTGSPSDGISKSLHNMKAHLHRYDSELVVLAKVTKHLSLVYNQNGELGEKQRLVHDSAILQSRVEGLQILSRELDEKLKAALALVS
jgi:hypothetical protein